MSLFLLALGTVLHFHLSRHLILENIALRHQILVYKRIIRKPKIRNLDRILWIFLYRLFPAWKDSLAIVKPATIIAWHRSASRIFWRWISRTKEPGRPSIENLLKKEIIRMALANPFWGPERILGELLNAGYHIHINTVRKYMPVRRRKRPGGTFKTFLDLHLDATAAMDFLVAFSYNFTPIYVFFIIHHGRRTILHTAATTHPTMEWLQQQLREAFQSDVPHPEYLIFDNDPVFRYSMDFMKNVLSITPVKTTPHSPWENGYAERFVRTLREELLDHVIPLSEKHLQKLVSEYVRYYNEDRTHSSLGRDSPLGRIREKKPPIGPLLAIPKVRGLHHRYIQEVKVA